jgi:4-diphosphocytidyl-2-C-methyl-D-erythritol kinase
MAAEIGSDVPFFLHGGTAVGEGRGERITPAPFYGALRLLLGFPPYGVSTAHAYEQTRLHLTAPSPDGKFQRFSNGKLPGANDFQLGRNDLEPAVFGMHSELRAFRDALLEGGAEFAMLSGSGSTVFGMFDDEEGLRRVRERLAGLFGGWRLFETRAVADGPQWVGENERCGGGTRGISE